MSDVHVNLSEMFSRYEPWDCSNSVANLGPRAAELTWNCSLSIAEDVETWLLSGDGVQWAREDASETGAWTAEEIASWTSQECLAYLVQSISHDLRLLGSDDGDLAECLANYENTDWGNEPEYPTSTLYLNDSHNSVCAML